MKKKNICVVVTARPSYSRIRSTLFELKKYPGVNLQIVAAASALLDFYGRVVNQIRTDGFEVTAEVYNVVSGESPSTSAKTTGLGIIELSSIFDNIHPDLVVTIADRFETMATAIAASYMNIPLVHIQGGEVTGNIDEKVRHAITKLADVHLVSTPMARERVIRMGERPESVHITGCPSIDIAKEVLDNYERLKFEPASRYSGVGNLLENREKYVVVENHPVTTELSETKKQTSLLLDAVEALGVQVYWFWPNMDAGSGSVSSVIRSHRENREKTNIYFFKNMKPDDFLVLLMGSVCVIGNSSVGIRECSYLGVPAINLGDRQIGRERGANVWDVPYERDSIIEAYRKIEASPRPASSELYGNGKAGERIASILSELGDVPINKKLNY